MSDDLIPLLKVTCNPLCLRAAMRIEQLERDLEEYKRLYDHRSKALQHPCLKCGYVPGIVKLAAADAAREEQ